MWRFWTETELRNSWLNPLWLTIPHHPLSPSNFPAVLSKLVNSVVSLFNNPIVLSLSFFQPFCLSHWKCQSLHADGHVFQPEKKKKKTLAVKIQGKVFFFQVVTSLQWPHFFCKNILIKLIVYCSGHYLPVDFSSNHELIMPTWPSNVYLKG